MRGLPAALVLLGFAPSLSAQTAPAGAVTVPAGPSVVVGAASIQQRADDLHGAAAAGSSGEADVAARGQRLSDAVSGKTPLFKPAPRRMDREPVDGHVGDMTGIAAVGTPRLDAYRKRFGPPPADLAAAVRYVNDLMTQGRLGFDASGTMPDNQMGQFDYDKDKSQVGHISINPWMKLMVTRIGDAFAYAAVVHQSAHALSHSERRLDAKRVTDAELEAYRVQYEWLTVMDPSSERLVVLNSALRLQLERHPEDHVTALSLKYTDHLLKLWDTHGKEKELREFIRKLGYHDGDADHDGGIYPGYDAMRV